MDILKTISPVLLLLVTAASIWVLVDWYRSERPRRTKMQRQVAGKLWAMIVIFAAMATWTTMRFMQAAQQDTLNIPVGIVGVLVAYGLGRYMNMARLAGIAVAAIYAIGPLLGVAGVMANQSQIGFGNLLANLGYNVVVLLGVAWVIRTLNAPEVKNLFAADDKQDKAMVAATRIECPNCKSFLELDREEASKGTFVCPECHAKIKL